ncbi:MAG: hypothetical protein IJ157_10325 [Clostridia bacterium]|nr:hypothetical protein [Clostridia bacterium]
MKGQMTVGQYRAVDLSLFALMLIVSETVIVSAATRWFPSEPYTVSAVAAITAIVMMRWRWWGALHAVLGGFVFCLVSHASMEQYAIYCVGNLFALAALIWIRAFTAEGLREDSFKSLVYAFTVVLLMHAGRALISLLFGARGQAALGFFATDVVSYLFTLLIVWIARRLDGVFEDQRHYLSRVNKEREEERGGF